MGGSGWSEAESCEVAASFSGSGVDVREMDEGARDIVEGAREMVEGAREIDDICEATEGAREPVAEVREVAEGVRDIAGAADRTRSPMAADGSSDIADIARVGGMVDGVDVVGNGAITT